MTVTIVIPAWGEHYVETAIKYTLPAAFAALKFAKWPRYKIAFYTDQPDRFLSYLQSSPYFGNFSFRPVPPIVYETGNGFHGLTAAHKETLLEAPIGSVVVLLNADILMSGNAIQVALDEFAKGKRVVATVGHRSLIRDEPPPVGADPKTLLDWCWRNRHPIAEDCVWGRGKTHLPTVLYFEHGDSVMMHCFHLCPVIVMKDREHDFVGTIDDDLLAGYRSREIFVPKNRELAFAELSPEWKKFRSARQLSVDFVVAFGRRRIQRSHIRNFAHSIRVIGDGPVNIDPAKEIAKRLQMPGGGAE